MSATVTPNPATEHLALVLSGGGARAAYQVGVLCHIGEKRPDLTIPILTGVSAGSINLGSLAGSRGSFADATRALRDKWLALSTDEVFRTDAPSLARIAARWATSLLSGGARFAPGARSLVDTGPLREFLEHRIDERAIADNLAAGRIRSVALMALSYASGRSVLFMQGALPGQARPGSIHYRLVRSRITIDHIMASAAIPILFPAVDIEGTYFGDGSFRSTAPLAPAIHLGARKIFAVSARYGRTAAETHQQESGGYPTPARIIGLLLNSVFLDTLDWDAAHLERINRLVRGLPADVRDGTPLSEVDLYIQRPSRDIGRLASEYELRLPRALRFLVRGLGPSKSPSSDFVSYLLFEPEYISQLIELGERDAANNWDRIATFLDA